MHPRVKEIFILCKTLVLIFVLMLVLVLSCTTTEKVSSFSLRKSISENKTSLDARDNAWVMLII